MSEYRLIYGDCIEEMKKLEDGSVDMILADIPYGTTACKWDSIIPFDPMWKQVKRILKQKSAIVFFGSQPFTSLLITSNLEGFAFCWVWNKVFAGNFVQAKRQPMKTHEDIVVFSLDGTQPKYFPQMVKRKKEIKSGGNGQGKEKAIRMKPKGDLKKTYTHKFPTSQIEFSSRSERGIHPTQKPVALMEYLIRTYTNKGETVLDFTCGSGSTGVASVLNKRPFIGIDSGYCEKEGSQFYGWKWVDVAEYRIKDETKQMGLF